jgi:hypothetical protein
MLPVPPVTDEPAPEREMWSTPPPDAPNKVVAAAEVIVSFGAAKTADVFSVVTSLLPEDVSAIAEPSMPVELSRWHPPDELTALPVPTLFRSRPTVHFPVARR